MTEMMQQSHPLTKVITQAQHGDHIRVSASHVPQQKPDENLQQGLNSSYNVKQTTLKKFATTGRNPMALDYGDFDEFATMADTKKMREFMPWPYLFDTIGLHVDALLKRRREQHLRRYYMFLIEREKQAQESSERADELIKRLQEELEKLPKFDSFSFQWSDEEEELEGGSEGDSVESKPKEKHEGSVEEESIKVVQPEHPQEQIVKQTSAISRRKEFQKSNFPSGAFKYQSQRLQKDTKFRLPQGVGFGSAITKQPKQLPQIQKTSKQGSNASNLSSKSQSLSGVQVSRRSGYSTDNQSLPTAPASPRSQPSTNLATGKTTSVSNQIINYGSKDSITINSSIRSKIAHPEYSPPGQRIQRSDENSVQGIHKAVASRRSSNQIFLQSQALDQNKQVYQLAMKKDAVNMQQQPQPYTVSGVQLPIDSFVGMQTYHQSQEVNQGSQIQQSISSTQSSRLGSPRSLQGKRAGSLKQLVGSSTQDISQHSSNQENLINCSQHFIDIQNVYDISQDKNSVGRAGQSNASQRSSIYNRPASRGSQDSYHQLLRNKIISDSCTDLDIMEQVKQIYVEGIGFQDLPEPRVIGKRPASTEPSQAQSPVQSEYRRPMSAQYDKKGNLLICGQEIGLLTRREKSVENFEGTNWVSTELGAAIQILHDQRTKMPEAQGAILQYPPYYSEYSQFRLYKDPYGNIRVIDRPSHDRSLSIHSSSTAKHKESQSNQSLQDYNTYMPNIDALLQTRSGGNAATSKAHCNSDQKKANQTASRIGSPPQSANNRCEHEPSHAPPPQNRQLKHSSSSMCSRNRQVMHMKSISPLRDNEMLENAQVSTSVLPQLPASRARALVSKSESARFQTSKLTHGTSTTQTQALAGAAQVTALDHEGASYSVSQNQSSLCVDLSFKYPESDLSGQTGNASFWATSEQQEQTSMHQKSQHGSSSKPKGFKTSLSKDRAALQPYLPATQTADSQELITIKSMLKIGSSVQRSNVQENKTPEKEAEEPIVEQQNVERGKLTSQGSSTNASSAQYEVAIQPIQLVTGTSLPTKPSQKPHYKQLRAKKSNSITYSKQTSNQQGRLGPWPSIEQANHDDVNLCNDLKIQAHCMVPLNVGDAFQQNPMQDSFIHSRSRKVSKQGSSHSTERPMSHNQVRQTKSSCGRVVGDMVIERTQLPRLAEKAPGFRALTSAGSINTSMAKLQKLLVNRASIRHRSLSISKEKLTKVQRPLSSPTQLKKDRSSVTSTTSSPRVIPGVATNSKQVAEEEAITGW